MALTAYLSLKGKSQGNIKGDVIQKGREGQIAIYAVNHEIISPRDAASGLATGKRVHKPLMITKEIDRSTPLLYKALVNNEVMTDFVLRFWAPNKLGTAGGSGMEMQNYTIRLTDASIANIVSTMENNKLNNSLNLPVLEEIAFTYQSIEWTWMIGGVTFTDTWSS